MEPSSRSLATDTQNSRKVAGLNFEPLRTIPKGQEGFPRGNCESCGLYIWSNGGYKLPGLKGYYCSVLCVECELFGPGRCRWCGEALEGRARHFCSDACARRSNETKFGDGTRLLNWLSKTHPQLYTQLVGQKTPGCLHCGQQLDEQRADAKFCSGRCKKAFKRRTVIRRSKTWRKRRNKGDSD